jgi:pimeloyl-ACP methyl ester carboxylesterase
MNETRYRQAEKKFWAWAGITPSEQWAQLTPNGVRVRVQVVGQGAPVLFVHGAPVSGSTWAPLVRHLDGFGCFLVDRPGTGLSDPLTPPLDVETLPAFGDSFIVDVLDALGIARAHLVGHSFGGYLGLRAAAAHPERIDRMVLVGCPAFIPGISLPPFMRLMTIGLARQILSVLPPNERAEKMIFRQIGHGASLDAGRIPQPYLEWNRALQRDTDTMRNEGDTIGRLGSPRRFDPSLTLTAIQLRAVGTPTLLLWGEDDGFGGSATARGVAELLPNAELELLPRSGHLPWIDDPVNVAHRIAAFLRRTAGRPDGARSAPVNYSVRPPP